MITYGPRGELLFSDGRPVWRGLKGEALTDREASALLRDIRRRVVKQTLVKNGRMRVQVSTVFIPIDQGPMSPAPVLWETMVFGGTLDGWQDRYTSRRLAKVGHEVAVIAVRIDLAIKKRIRERRSRMHAAYRNRKAFT